MEVAKLLEHLTANHKKEGSSSAIARHQAEEGKYKDIFYQFIDIGPQYMSNTSS